MQISLSDRFFTTGWGQVLERGWVTVVEVTNQLGINILKLNPRLTGGNLTSLNELKKSLPDRLQALDPRSHPSSVVRDFFSHNLSYYERRIKRELAEELARVLLIKSYERTDRIGPAASADKRCHAVLDSVLLCFINDLAEYKRNHKSRMLKELEDLAAQKKVEIHLRDVQTVIHEIQKGESNALTDEEIEKITSLPVSKAQKLIYALFRVEVRGRQNVEEIKKIAEAAFDALAPLWKKEPNNKDAAIDEIVSVAKKHLTAAANIGFVDVLFQEKWASATMKLRMNIPEQTPTILMNILETVAESAQAIRR